MSGAAHMAAALTLARRGLGQVWPNPAVGCVLVKDEVVIGRGWTQAGGRPHAETEALARAGAAAKGATAYVTLEPCAHTGQAPPCAEALIAAGVSRVFSAIEDPDERVAGRGHAMLRDAGIAVEIGLMQEEAARLNQGFFLRIREGRPRVMLKLATSLDGRIATHSGASRWITGLAARAHAHLGRAMNDAILVGSNTALLDDPELTCRLPGAGRRSPVRVVADGRLRLSLTSKLVRSAGEVPVWLITRSDADPARLEAFAGCGIEILKIDPDQNQQMAPAAILAALAGRGITRVLLEGGAHLAAGFLRAGLVDRLAWYRAPMAIGGDGIPALAGLGIDGPDAALRFTLRGRQALGEDMLELYDIRP